MILFLVIAAVLTASLLSFVLSKLLLKRISNDTFFGDCGRFDGIASLFCFVQTAPETYSG